MGTRGTSTFSRRSRAIRALCLLFCVLLISSFYSFAKHRQIRRHGFASNLFSLLFLKLYELTAASCFLDSVLCSVLMYDLKLRNSAPTCSPNRKQFVSKVLPQLTGLQELAREKEMGGSDVSVANVGVIEKDVVKDKSRDSDDRKEAIKRLKTSE